MPRFRRPAVAALLAVLALVGVAGCRPINSVPPAPGLIDTWLLVQVLNPNAHAYEEPVYPNVPVSIYVEVTDRDGKPGVPVNGAKPGKRVTYAVRSQTGDGGAWRPAPKGDGIRFRIQGDKERYPLTVTMIVSFTPNAFERAREFRLACQLAGHAFEYVDDDITWRPVATGQLVVKCSGIVRAPA